MGVPGSFPMFPWEQFNHAMTRRTVICKPLFGEIHCIQSGSCFGAISKTACEPKKYTSNSRKKFICIVDQHRGIVGRSSAYTFVSLCNSRHSVSAASYAS